MISGLYKEFMPDEILLQYRFRSYSLDKESKNCKDILDRPRDDKLGLDELCECAVAHKGYYCLQSDNYDAKHNTVDASLMERVLDSIRGTFNSDIQKVLRTCERNYRENKVVDKRYIARTRHSFMNEAFFVIFSCYYSHGVSFNEYYVTKQIEVCHLSGAGVCQSLCPSFKAYQSYASSFEAVCTRQIYNFVRYVREDPRVYQAILENESKEFSRLLQDTANFDGFLKDFVDAGDYWYTCAGNAELYSNPKYDKIYGEAQAYCLLVPDKSFDKVLIIAFRQLTGTQVEVYVACLRTCTCDSLSDFIHPLDSCPTMFTSGGSTLLRLSEYFEHVVRVCNVTDNVCCVCADVNTGVSACVYSTTDGYVALGFDFPKWVTGALLYRYREYGNSLDNTDTVTSVSIQSDSTVNSEASLSATIQLDLTAKTKEAKMAEFEKVWRPYCERYQISSDMQIREMMRLQELCGSKSMLKLAEFINTEFLS